MEKNDVVVSRGLNSTLLAGFIHTDKQKRFAPEMDNSPTILCNKTVYPAKIQNVYVILENWDLENHEVNSVDASRQFQSRMWRAGGVVYLHQCVKMGVFEIENTFCTEEEPVRIGRDQNSVIRYMHPITRVFYTNYTVTECNPFYPNLLKLANGT